LDYYGITESETTLRIKCKCKASGTHPINAVECARSYGFENYVDLFEVHDLQKLLQANVPPIVNILVFENEPPSLHSVIVTRLTPKYAEILDPEEGHKKLSLQEFLADWQAANQIAILVTKPS